MDDKQVAAQSVPKTTDSGSRGHQEEEVRWVDAWIRWKEDEGQDSGSDEEEPLPDPFREDTPTEVFTFDFGEIHLELDGYKEDSDEIWKSTGLTLWRASNHLCEHLVLEPLLTSKANTILELGAGLGLCGILAHKLSQQAKVIVTDGDTHVLAQLRHNVRQHATNDHLECCQLLWGPETAATFREKRGIFHLILASDVIYVPEVVQPLFETVQTLLDPQGVFVLAFAKRRVPVSVESVLETAARNQFVYECRQHDNDGIFLYEFRHDVDY